MHTANLLSICNDYLLKTGPTNIMTSKTPALISLGEAITRSSLKQSNLLRTLSFWFWDPPKKGLKKPTELQKEKKNMKKKDPKPPKWKNTIPKHPRHSLPFWKVPRSSRASPPAANLDPHSVGTFEAVRSFLDCSENLVFLVFSFGNLLFPFGKIMEN